MNNLIWIISSAIILVLVSVILNSVYKNSKIKDLNIENNIIILKPNKIHFYVGIAGITILPILTLLTVLFPAQGTLDSDTQKILFVSLMFLILMLFIYLTFFYLNYKIILYKDYFVYQNFFRCKKSIKYSEIKIDNSKSYTTIQIKNKKGNYRNLFKLNPYLDNSEFFMEYYKSAKKQKKK